MAISPKEMEHVANTVVGESILIAGKLEGDEDLTVRGRVHGSITLTRTLIVEHSGVVKADATVRNAIISGVVVGNITASESVELTREGRMVGDIRAPRVIIVDGAAFRGRVDMGDADVERPVERSARPQSVPSAPPRLVRPMPTPPPVRSAPPVRPSPPARPAPPPPRPPAVTSISRPAAPSRAAQPKPPAPPPPPKVVKSPANAPAPAAVGKRKVIVKRKK